MTTQPMARWRAALNTQLLDDVLRESTLAGMQKVAPQSPLMQVPAAAASYAVLVLKGATLVADIEAAAADEAVYRASVARRDASRLAFDLELCTLKAIVDNNATSASDVTSMGFLLLDVLKPSRTPPDPPGTPLVKIGRAHGKARVVVPGKGFQGRFSAEASTDPAGEGPWFPLPGTGKERKLAGYASGTKIWVRFARVRFGMQSAWSVAVLVTIP